MVIDYLVVLAALILAFVGTLVAFKLTSLIIAMKTALSGFPLAASGFLSALSFFGYNEPTPTFFESVGL